MACMYVWPCAAASANTSSFVPFISAYSAPGSEIMVKISSSVVPKASAAALLIRNSSNAWISV